MSDGLGLGHNTRAAIITRGLAEVNRLATRLGADPLTVTGLAGMGDLVLTCTGELSRNRSLGLRLGKGEKLADVLAAMTQVAEGVRNTLAVDDLARSLGVEMPITAQMRCLLFEDKSAHEAMVDLMTRQLKHEFRESEMSKGNCKAESCGKEVARQGLLHAPLPPVEAGGKMAKAALQDLLFRGRLRRGRQVAQARCETHLQGQGRRGPTCRRAGSLSSAPEGQARIRVDCCSPIVSGESCARVAFADRGTALRGR